MTNGGKQMSEFKPTKKEIAAMNHYWAYVQAKIKGQSMNRKARRKLLRKSHARG